MTPACRPCCRSVRHGRRAGHRRHRIVQPSVNSVTRSVPRLLDHLDRLVTPRLWWGWETVLRSWPGSTAHLRGAVPVPSVMLPRDARARRPPTRWLQRIMGEFGPEVVRLPSPWAADTARSSGPPRSGIDPGCIPDLPGGGDVCLAAESGELAVDEAISPGRASVDRRRISACTLAGMPGRPGRTGVAVQRRVRSCPCQRGKVEGVVISPSVEAWAVVG